MRKFYKMIKNIVENNKIFTGPNEIFTRPNDFLLDSVRRSFEFGEHCMLTPFQVVSNSNSKVFGGLNLFQCLLVKRVVKVYLIAREVPSHPH